MVLEHTDTSPPKCTAVIIVEGGQGTPCPIHDVAVNNVTSVPANSAIQGDNVTINVDVENKGGFTESFDVEVTYDGMHVCTVPVGPLPSETVDSISCDWNTSRYVCEDDVSKELAACAEVVPGEFNIADNCFATTFELRCPPQFCGDLDADGDVDGDDRSVLRGAFRTCTGDAGFIAEADYDVDGCINFRDYREWYKCYKAFIATP